LDCFSLLSHCFCGVGFVLILFCLWQFHHRYFTVVSSRLFLVSFTFVSHFFGFRFVQFYESFTNHFLISFLLNESSKGSKTIGSTIHSIGSISHSISSISQSSKRTSGNQEFVSVFIQDDALVLLWC